MNAHTRIFWQVTENKLRINYDTHKEGDMIALQSKDNISPALNKIPLQNKIGNLNDLTGFE